VVVRQLAEQGINYRELGREEFEKGASGNGKKRAGGNDSTADAARLGIAATGRAKNSRCRRNCRPWCGKAFVRLYEEGLIYRENRLFELVSGVPDGAERFGSGARGERARGTLWHIKYPVARNERVFSLWATHAGLKTMLGDNGPWRVNPEDERYEQPGWQKKAPNCRLMKPGDSDYRGRNGGPRVWDGRGENHTPAHDPNDFEVGAGVNKLRKIDVMTDRRQNETRRRGPTRRWTAFEAREKVCLRILKAGGGPASKRLTEQHERHRIVRTEQDDCRAASIERNWFLQDEAVSGAGR